MLAITMIMITDSTPITPPTIAALLLPKERDMIACISILKEKGGLEREVERENLAVLVMV